MSFVVVHLNFFNCFRRYSIIGLRITFLIVLNGRFHSALLSAFSIKSIASLIQFLHHSQLFFLS